MHAIFQENAVLSPRCKRASSMRRSAAQAFNSSATGLTNDRQTHMSYHFELLAAVNARWPLWCASQYVL
jgi:hypothetical protein